MTPAAAAAIEEIAHRFTTCVTEADRDRVADAIKAVIDEDRPTEPTGDQP